MSAPASDSRATIDVMRQQARMAHQVVRLNTDGISHEESLRQPLPAGNCLNWVVGHLVAIYHRALPLVGQTPVMPAGSIAPYDRGSPPLGAAADAIPFSDLLAAWEESSRRFDAGLADMATDALAAPAPISPSDDPNETIGSLLSTISWHQAYHAGQTGILRRLAGREGAIR